MGKCMKSDLGTLFSQVVGKTSYIFIENVPNRFVQSSKELEFISQNRLCWFLFFSHPIFFFSKLFPQKVPMHVGRISILSLQSSHIFFKMFKMRKYWVPIEANRILWQKLAKKGEMSPITLSLPLKARKRPLPDGFLSTMKVEVSNKYSKVYCCCHLCSKKSPLYFSSKSKKMRF